MSSKFSTPFMAKSPLNQEGKFLTTAQPAVMNPKENIKMTPKERAEGRKGLANAVSLGLTLNPTIGGGAKLAKGLGTGARGLIQGGFGNLIKSNAGKIANFLGQKLGLKGTTTGVTNITK